jgi:hypothetical protein
MTCPHLLYAAVGGTMLKLVNLLLTVAPPSSGHALGHEPVAPSQSGTTGYALPEAS